MRTTCHTDVNLPRGFTLAEMLVVFFFIGIMTTAVMANVRSGNQTEILRQAVNTLTQDIRTVQNYAVGGRKFSICEGTYKAECTTAANCSGYALACGTTTYPDCIPPMDCGDVPEGGYGIAFTQNNGYTIYADTYTDETMAFATGQQRWYQSSGTPSDPASPVRSVLFTNPSVSLFAVQYTNTGKICGVGPKGANALSAYVTFEPPFAAGHVILYEKVGASETYSQDTTQLLRLWIRGKGSFCHQIEVNGVTGRVTNSPVSCPTLDPTCVNA